MATGFGSKSNFNLEKTQFSPREAEGQGEERISPEQPIKVTGFGGLVTEGCLAMIQPGNQIPALSKKFLPLVKYAK